MTKACGAVLFLCVILGGGTHVGFLGDIVIQIAALTLFVVSLWRVTEDGWKREQAGLCLSLFAVAVGIMILQLVPLPFAAWESLNYFQPSLAGVGLNRVWRPLSVSPSATRAAVASLIVPLAIFTATLQLAPRQRRSLAWVLIVAGAMSLALGFLQVAQGPDSSLRFFDFTNPTEAVGFFANRNHFAALLYITLILAGMWFVQTVGRMRRRSAFKSRSLLWLAGAAVFLTTIFAGLALARSRAGIALAMVGMFAIVFLARRPRGAAGGHDVRPAARTVSVGTVIFAVLFAAQFGLGGLLSRFEGDALEDLRVPLTITTFQTATQALPFGFGLGSFVPVYATVEKTTDIFQGYANRAHNDLAEVILETGLVGVALLIWFLVWFLRRSYHVWMVRSDLDDRENQLLERTASIAIALLFLHSLVDYPLRTGAIAGIFAYFCAVLAVPPVRESPTSPPPAHRRRIRRRVIVTQQQRLGFA